MTDSLETPSHSLAKEYIRLGGKRQVKIDDNRLSLRQWEGDPPEAERFWQEKIETLPDEKRKQVVDYLPDITEN